MIPVATCTVTVRRPSGPAGVGVDTMLASYGLPTDEGGVPLSYDTVATGLRGHIGAPGGSENNIGGDQENMSFHLTCDPFDFQQRDQVVNERTGIVFEVVTAALRDDIAFMAHSQVQLSRVRGLDGQ